ncbi:MAG: hypothetical protein DCC67_07735 [Planctomycetota bacterium]|nr:MAG: hypothetical protein DCC67_07735 [Planctomycetota bacterium]
MEPPLARPAEPRPTPYRPLVWLAAAAALGIAADYYAGQATQLRLLPWWWATAVALLAAAEQAARRGYSHGGAVGLLLAAGATAAAWHHWRWNEVPCDDLSRYAIETPQPVCVEAVLADRIRILPPGDDSPLRAIPARTFSEGTIRASRIRDGVQWRPADGLSRLRVAGVVYDLEPGAKIRLFAQLARPLPRLNPGEYDWSAAERRQGRLSELYCVDPRCIEVIRPAAPLGMGATLRAIRRWCQRQLAAHTAPEDAPLALATLLGDQERLSDSTREAFLRTGSIHLLVVSGAHVALVAGLAWRIARGASLSRRAQLWITSTSVVVYGAIVGPQPSVMRATILTLATLAALTRGRLVPAGNLLAGAALCVMAYNPGEVFRSGTQFSFLAVAVLIAFARWRARASEPTPLERLIRQSRPWAVRAARSTGAWFLEMTAASLAVGVAMAPLVSYHFHVVTPASILLTPIVGPLIAISLAAGVGVVTAGALLPPLDDALGYLCGRTLHLAEWLVIEAQDIPGSYFYTTGLAAWWLWVFYGAGGLLAAIPKLRPPWPWQMSAALVWLAVGYAAAGRQPSSQRELRCTFLAVGHGACVVVELPAGQTLLYDAGSLGSPDAVARTISSFLWSRGIDRIDGIVLSHADVDHYNAVPGLIERFPIEAVYVSPMMFDPVGAGGDLNAPNYLRTALRNAGIPLRDVWLGDRLRTAGPDVTIEVLHPPQEGVIGRDSANSVVLCIEYGGKRILLPGDLESPGIDQLMEDPPLDCDVLLAPHHGSGGSNPPGFAAWTTPQWVIMSGSEPDRTETTQRSYSERGAAVFHTAADGAVEVRITAGAVVICSFR